MKQPKEKRRGGVFDDTIIHINFTRDELDVLIKETPERAKAKSQTQTEEKDLTNECTKP